MSSKKRRRKLIRKGLLQPTRPARAAGPVEPEGEFFPMICPLPFCRRPRRCQRLGIRSDDEMKELLAEIPVCYSLPEEDLCKAILRHLLIEEVRAERNRLTPASRARGHMPVHPVVP